MEDEERNTLQEVYLDPFIMKKKGWWTKAEMQQYSKNRDQNSKIV